MTHRGKIESMPMVTGNHRHTGKTTLRCLGLNDDRRPSPYTTQQTFWQF